MSNQEVNEEIILENRQDLIEFLKTTKYEYIMLKFFADWCGPCNKISPFVNNLADEKIKTNSNFIFIEVNVDECFDLYAFLKKQKMIKGIPSIFLYKKEILNNIELEHYYIPQVSISGTNETEIKKIFNF